ncbi:membrane-associated protein, putative [Bodo saltans]|uniref:Membrane-associated protein, putative n=1 Tax=Bodo saltans TaxID=75058 RepID=A0A0S4IUZ1_BODSA|nr:membrane-associated protein, putative [Bodo saltans]|eukprot:CUF43954.1 membrane-associated protein, putative [Bodo saltans]
MASNFAFFLAMTLIHLGVASWCRILGPITVTSLVTVTGSYHLVTLTEVTFSGVAAGIRINVGDMMATHGTSTPLSIQMCSCTFTSGASLYLYGRTSPVSTATNSAPLTLNILGLIVNNAGIGFYGEMPYNSRISIVRPTYNISGGGSTYPQIPGGPHTASGLLIASAAFRAGSFLFYGQPLSLTANTFAGSAGYGVTFEGTTTIASSCMFHIFQLSSVNTYPIYGAGATITISGASVLYIEEMEALSCTTCVTLGTIVLLSSSIFLLNKGNFAGGTGFVFSGSSDSSNNWFGMMGNAFDASNAVVSPSGFSGNYMSIFGNYYHSGWSQSSSTCWAMCNSNAGNLVESPASGCSGSNCTVSTFCAGASYSKSQCYYTMATLACVSQKPSCSCTNAAATTDYCIPFSAPKIPIACVFTQSYEITTSITATLTAADTVTATASATQSSTLTSEMSLSESKRSPTLSQSSSKYASLSVSCTSSWSITRSKATLTLSLNESSSTVELSPTRHSITPSRQSREESHSMSLSNSMSDELAAAPASPIRTAKPTATIVGSKSMTRSTTAAGTPTSNVTRSWTAISSDLTFTKIVLTEKPTSFAEKVQIAGDYSQIASIVAGGGASSGSALGRVIATRSVALCSATSSVEGGVIDFNFHLCVTDSLDDSITAAAADLARSAIVSNVVLIAIAVVFFVALVALWSAMGRLALMNAVCVFCLPSSLMPVLTAVVPSTIASATFLLAELRSSSSVGCDIALGLIGLVIGLLPLVGFVWIWAYIKIAGWSCVRRDATSDTVDRQRLSLVTQCTNVISRVTHRVHTWQKNGQIEKSLSLQAAWVVLLEFRDLRYGVADAAVLAVVSCLSVVSGLSTSTSQCRVWSLVVLLLLVGQLVLLMATRPLTSLLANVYAALTLVLTILSTLTQLVFVWAYAADTEEGGWLMDASAVFSLAVVGISAAKMLLDIQSVIVAIRRRLVAFGTKVLHQVFATRPLHLDEDTINDDQHMISADEKLFLMQIDTPDGVLSSLSQRPNRTYEDAFY